MTDESRSGAAPATTAEILPVRSHGRYLARPPVAPSTSLGIVVGFHGYGESAAVHLDELARIPGAEGWTLVAIDALHAFYDRKGERVLRSWMTRELRAETIEDNVRYVRAVLDSVRPRVGWALPLAFLGFSQGASMAWRAALLAGHGARAVVALAGDIPPELASGPFPEGMRALVARGADDEWYAPARMASDLDRLGAQGVLAEALTFVGGHLFTDEFRRVAGRFLADTFATP